MRGFDSIFQKQFVWRRIAAILVIVAFHLPAQNSTSISQFFEGKQVTVKLDMPATQQGIDIYPQRPQTLDVKSYSSRLKKFGTSLRDGDKVVITRVKVKDNNIEFQLGGGGYGTAFDDTDSSVHFTPADKSNREKELQDQLNTETDPDRRRSLQGELDDVRAGRERQDRRDRARAEDAADNKKQRIDVQRQQGGSRFNIRFDVRKSGDALTPQIVMASLEKYVTFPSAAFPGSETAAAPYSQTPAGYTGPPPPPPAPGDAESSLKKGMTLEQVEALFGKPTETHDSDQNGLKMTSSTFQDKEHKVKADFVNGVLVQYTLSSR